uniref:Uncharacterized protein n=1 Tax=Sphaerodactylus townsendi TaxID=933632 RepID=A0ACB8G6G7_9SAUR
MTFSFPLIPILVDSPLDEDQVMEKMPVRAHNANDRDESGALIQQKGASCNQPRSAVLATEVPPAPPVLATSQGPVPNSHGLLLSASPVSMTSPDTSSKALPAATEGLPCCQPKAAGNSPSPEKINSIKIATATAGQRGPNLAPAVAVVWSVA